MDYSIVDMETDGLIETVTKIHCLSVKRHIGDEIYKFSLTDPDEIRDFYMTEPIIVGHNLIRFDVPVAEKVLKFILPNNTRMIDSLGLSWYLYPERIKHGLEEWGDDLGIQKPPISDWSNLTVEDYIYRCEQDTEINDKVFDLQIDYLNRLYNGDGEQMKRIINYITFKLQCAREQEEVKWRLDVDKCKDNLKFFEEELKRKIEAVADIMPVVKKYKDIPRPKTLYKKDETISVAGQKWLDLLKEMNLPDYHIGTLKVPISEERGNPRSHRQLKSWLFSLGWIPETFEYPKDKKTGEMKKIPQINTKDDGICESVKKLYDKIPELVSLEGLFIVSHRIGILNGFLEEVDKDGLLKAEIGGFTNTLRFQHKKPLVNLPTVPKPYWEKIRGCLIAPDDDHILCGSDMSGLEDQTKRHYMWKHDPEYVKEMMSPDFDPHFDIAILARMATKEEQVFYKWLEKQRKLLKDDFKPTKEEKERYEDIKGRRLRAKRVNFGGTYGAGPPKLAQTGGFSLAEGRVLHKVYWKRNWSVKKIAEECIVKTIGNQMWLYNPVSEFWYSLRYEKDKFSTLNQGTGVYCFDTWVRNVGIQDVRNCGQFHDEIISPVLKTLTEEHSQKLKNAINRTNEELQLNVTLGISIDYGHSYAEIH